MLERIHLDAGACGIHEGLVLTNVVHCAAWHLLWARVEAAQQW